MMPSGSIEAAPERKTTRSLATAEKPVTTRIRQRTATVSPDQPVIEPDLAAASAALPPPPASVGTADPELVSPPVILVPQPAAVQIPSVRPRSTFREGVLRDERRNARQMSLF
jgi:hypothetical protein